MTNHYYSGRLIFAGAAGLLTLAVQTTSGQSSEALINKLVDKGILTAQEAQELREEEGRESEPEIRMSWQDGLTFESGDKKFHGKLGGRLDLDMAGFSADDGVEALPDVGDVPAGVEFRRVRLGLEGEYRASTPSFYKVELDFADAEVAFKDVYMGLKEIPAVGSIQVGHFKEPVGLEMLTSSRYLTFMERALPIEAFAPERNTGVMIGDHILGDRMTWAAGGFTDVGDSGDGPIDSNYRVTGRVTGLPWYEDDGRRLLHLGVSGSYIDPNGDVRFRSRPEAHMAPRFVDTRMGMTDIASDQAWLAGAEAALVCGPFSLQGEYLRTWVDTMAGGTAEFDGYYVSGSWFLTGENRRYKRSNGAFDRIHPRKNFSLPDGGIGAWEVAVRYSGLNLNDAGITGGCLNDLTAGLNWYLNPNLKFQMNYVYSMVDRTVGGVNHDGDAQIFEGRLHVDF